MVVACGFLVIPCGGYDGGCYGEGSGLEVETIERKLLRLGVFLHHFEKVLKTLVPSAELLQQPSHNSTISKREDGGMSLSRLGDIGLPGGGYNGGGCDKGGRLEVEAVLRKLLWLGGVLSLSLNSVLDALGELTVLADLGAAVR
ncbi:hypothetical protein M5K25_012926 [Dendrobium thyrsiflorum]|uniref:Uncharacterized protein n=1 Tax=Dendrobium thyrsiflorum TaxID=117978 RepID=A0ABD0UYE6_DENTH